MNRLAVYVLWEKSGIVRDYVIAYLKGLQEVASKVIVVVNGLLTSEGRIQLEKLGVQILVRENVGVDFWAYKRGMELQGDELYSYEDIILANCSCYGPIYPFSEMFAKMDAINCDFWGITEWPEDHGGYQGTWILSYFMVFRKHVIQSPEWIEYWRNLSEVHSRDECIEKHETKFTSYLASKGFRYEVYCHNSSKYIDMTIEAPDELVIKQRCPIIKRKAFYADYERFLSYHRGNASKAVFQYLEREGLYDVNIILDDLLATQHYYNVKNCLHLNYFLPSDRTLEEYHKGSKVALFFHVYYEDLLDRCFQYMSSFREVGDIFITTPKNELVPKIAELQKQYNLPLKGVKVVSARGRAESAFLVNTSEYYNYDYICVVHDKKSSFLVPAIRGLEFGFHNHDSLIKTDDYVRNIISIFDRSPRLGMLVPINLIYGDYKYLYGQEWGSGNYEGVVKLLKEFHVDIPIAPEIPPVLPAGAMFWIRPASMKKLLDKPWHYEDFPQEPLQLDGSLIHVIERAYSYFVQDAGYLTGWVSAIEDAEVHLTNISYLYRNIRVSIANDPGQIVTVNQGLKSAFKIYLKKHLPRPVFQMCKNIYHVFRRV